MYTSVELLKNRKAADLLVLPCWQGKREAKPLFEVKELRSEVEAVLQGGDFLGKQGTTVLVYLKKKREKRLLLLGLGEEKECTMESLRRAYSACMKRAQNKKWKHFNVALPLFPGLSSEEVCRAVCEGLSLSHYVFETLKSENKNVLYLEKVTLIGMGKEAVAIGSRTEKITAGVNFARDLINGNAKDVTPEALANQARYLAKSFSKVKTTVFDKKRIEKEGMGLLLAVSAGSAVDPAFIIVKYEGNPASSDHTVVIGKGVTFDTGGLNLKPTGSIEDMKCDMSGAAAALGLILALAKLDMPVNVTAVIAATENAIDARSYKPGDVFSSYSGKTVEITNTDAEGRLTLADAVAYVEDKLSPSRMIDMATLTGAIVVSLGAERTGLFANDAALAEVCEKAGEMTGERVWQLPMDKEYKEYLKSTIADIKNCGKRKGSSITAALFIQEFIKKVPWIHLDIAGTAYLDEPKHYHTTPATGVGVRLIVEMLGMLNGK